MARLSKAKEEDIVEGFIKALMILWGWADRRVGRLIWWSFGLAIAGIASTVASLFWSPAIYIAWVIVIVDFVLIAYILGIVSAKNKVIDMTAEVIGGETESEQS